MSLLPNSIRDIETCAAQGTFGDGDGGGGDMATTRGMLESSENGSDAKLGTTDQGGIKIQLDGSGISGGDTDARVEAADQAGVIGDELDDSGRALGIRGENACDEAVAAGDMVAEQGTSGDGDGGSGGTAMMGDERGSPPKIGMTDRPTDWGIMSPNQRKQWARRRK